MKKSIHLPRVVGLSVLLLSLTGCGDFIGELQQLAKEVAFDNLVERAESNGGKAELVQPGQEIILEITDETSPIFGTKVIIPADGLPNGISEAVLAAYHLDRFNNRDNKYALSGPAVTIQLQDLTTNNVGDAITLTENATVFIPFNDETDATPLYLGHQGYNGGFSWNILESTLDSEKPRLVGTTKEFNTFAVLSDAPGDPIVTTYSYSVTDSVGDVVCAGDEVTAVTVKTLIFDADQSQFILDIDDSFALTVNYPGHATSAPAAEDITLSTRTVNCGAGMYTSNALPTEEDFSLTVSSTWEATGVEEDTVCGGDSTPCDIYTGDDATAQFATTFKDGGNTVTLSFSGAVTDITDEIARP